MKIRIIVTRSLKVHVRYVHERKNPREVRFGSHRNLHIENVHEEYIIQMQYLQKVMNLQISFIYSIAIFV